MKADAGTTGRLEVTIYPNSLKSSGDGILVHSKAKGEGFPSRDLKAFQNKVKAIKDKLQWYGERGIWRKTWIVLYLVDDSMNLEL